MFLGISISALDSLLHARKTFILVNKSFLKRNLERKFIWKKAFKKTVFKKHVEPTKLSIINGKIMCLFFENHRRIIFVTKRTAFPRNSEEFKNKQIWRTGKPFFGEDKI